jgi:UDP-N-acetylglucosamine 2-epimerase (non-hydrolysing)
VSALSGVFEESPPAVLVVQGDTNTTMAGALAANALEIPLVHVEAGLRSHDRRMPEEHNRVVTDHLGDLLCAPTELNRHNLLSEGIDSSRVLVTGNTVVEAVQQLMPVPAQRTALLGGYGLEPGEFVLSTFHRPENVDDADRFSTIVKQLSSLPYPVVLPLHPRSRDRTARFGLDRDLEAIKVIDPIGYRDFLGLSAESAFLVSDSGGIQEEASIYKRPVVVVRRSTERPEVLGTFARLVEPDHIGATVSSWLADLAGIHHELSGLPSPYGDGSASDRIVGALGELLEGG